MMSSPASHSTSMSARELYLLWQRAETFRVELELERQLQLKGTATLPPEWFTYLEHERQTILDKIRMESREEDFSPAYPTHTISPIRGHNESTRGLHPTVSPIRQEESVHSFVLSENDGNIRSPSHVRSTTFSEESSSPEARTSPDSLSSTVHDHTISPDDRIRRSSAIALGSPSVDHEIVRRGNSLRVASPRRVADLRGVDRADYQPHSRMFNGTQNATISGGVFMYVQGNVSYTGDEMLAPSMTGYARSSGHYP